jgi:hypothetical protein
MAGRKAAFIKPKRAFFTPGTGGARLCGNEMGEFGVMAGRKAAFIKPKRAFFTPPTGGASREESRLRLDERREVGAA